MDFFAAQARARTKTRQLIALLAGAVVCLTISSYVIVAGLRALWLHYYEPGLSVTLWHPWLLASLTLITGGLIGGASWWKWRQLRKDGLLIIRQLGARWVSPGSGDIIERRLVNIVEEMAIASGVPVPAVFVLESETSINAFAAGLTPQDAAIAVTRGALDQLSRDELQGVIAHEFSHILNNDTRMNTVLMAVVHGLLFGALTGEGIFKDWELLEESPLYFAKVFAAFVRIPAGIAVCAFGYAGYFLGRLIVATISRQREYLSDAAAVQFTRNPAGLTGALRKIGLGGGVVVTTRVREIRHFFFTEACESRLGAWFATHPLWLDRVHAIDAHAARFIVTDTLERGRLVTDDSPDRPGVARVTAPTPGAMRQHKPAPRSTRPAHAAHAPAFNNNNARASNTYPDTTTNIPQNTPPDITLDTTGTITAAPAEPVGKARRLLAEIDPALLNAARQPDTAPGLVLGLLLDHNAGVRRVQWDCLTYLGGAPVTTIGRLEPALLQMPVGHRLPLLQLSLPTLRGMSGQDVARFWRAADKLAQCDGRITIFEYSLLRMVQRHLVTVAAVPMRKTKPARMMTTETGGAAGIVLTALARCGGADEATARHAFHAGKSRLGALSYFATWHEPDRPAPGDVSGPVSGPMSGNGLRGKTNVSPFRTLDAALDRLAGAPLETKRTILAAAEATVMADGKRHIEEIELFRMMSDSLGCPMPLA
jgi:Zn-dependent protease with chaperone function